MCNLVRGRGTDGMRVYGMVCQGVTCLVTTVFSAWYMYESSKMDFDNAREFEFQVKMY